MPVGGCVVGAPPIRVALSRTNEKGMHMIMTSKLNLVFLINCRAAEKDD